MEYSNDEEYQLFCELENLKAENAGLRNKLAEYEKLFVKLDEALEEWERRTPKGYANAERVIFKCFDDAFAKNPQKAYAKRKFAEKRKDKLKTYVTVTDGLLLQRAIRSHQKILRAEEYLNASLGDGSVRYEKKQATALKIVGLKVPGKKRAKHGEDELIAYATFVNSGMKANEAAEEIQKKYQHQSQLACNKWLFEQLTIKRREAQRLSGLGNESIFLNIPFPNKNC